MALSGAVQAQTPNGAIVGRAPANASITVTSPDTGVRREIRANPDGSFTISQLPAGRYRVASEGTSRDVTVAGGADTRVTLEGAQHAETVTVTGSRIQRDTFNSASPVQVITRDDNLMSGFDSTTAALQSTAVTAGGGQINNAFGGFVTDGGPGANTLGLRGLGPSRTLILLNGRRLAPAGTRGAVGSADLNVLPNAVIDRIEILKDGASSIYGSDAVAGVVNIITRRNIQGVTLEGQYNKPEGGGGESTRASVTAGWTGERGFFSGSFEHYDRNALLWRDRDWMACQTDYRRRVVNGVPGEWGSLDFIDPLTGKPKCYGITGAGNNGATINTLGTGTLAGVGAAGSVGTTFNRWRPNSAINTGLVGFEGVGGGANNLNVRDTFDPAMMNTSLVSPVVIRTAFLQGGYDLRALGSAEVYFEGLFSNRKSSQVAYRQLSYDYARGSPLIPASLANVPNVQATPSVFTGTAPAQLRTFIGFGNDLSQQDVDYAKVLGGLRGNMPFRDWTYDGVITFAKSDATYERQTFLTSRVVQSLDVVAGPNGTFTCRNTANGCVAAPVLSSAVLAGHLPQAWRDFIFVNDVGHTKYEETTATINATGTLFELWHGPVRGAIGIEWRRAEIDDTPSLDSQNGNLLNLTSAAITRGSDSVKELYGEMEFPLLRGIRGAEELTVNVSGRFTDYKSYGSDTTYKAGVLYTPVKWVSLRASHGTSYRAPAVFEQYQGTTSGFLSQQSDPCNNWGARDPSDPRRANCASEGLPPDFQAIQGIQVNQIGGASTGLKAETSKNTTVGLILQPALPTGMGDVSLAVDYFDIKVDNGVAQVGGGNILSLCYDDPAFRAGGSFCRLVTRGTPSGPTALLVNDSFVNLSQDVVKGYDITLRFTRNIGPGQLRLNALYTKYTKQANKLFPDDPLESFNNTIGNPDRTAAVDLQYTWKEWKFRYGAEWVGGMSSYEFFGQNPATSTFQMATPDYTTHNFSVQYKADKWSATVGVRNFLDEDLPQISQGFTNLRRGNAPIYSGYDYFGRTYFVNVSKTF
jgi:outer membrane receptor protein involved in Fe transport